MIHVTCSNCGLKILVPATVQGRLGLCFGCGAKVHVPITAKAGQSPDLSYSKGDRVADRYVISNCVGKGGMGVVYKALDSLIDEDVALKFMIPRMLKTQKGQQLFIKEAQIARRLRHANIVAVHDVNTTVEGVLYLSMEYLDGSSLRAFLRKHRVDRKLIDVRLAIRITLQILEALEYAHQMVVHRDLKPENVMILPGEHAKVLDFGLAIAVEEEDEEPKENDGKKKIIGTRAYAAPEQYQHRPIDFRADLYTVGLLVHEMLTLRTPLDEPVSIVNVRQDVAPSVVSVIDRALVEEREDRWQSAGEFHEHLKMAYDEAYRSTTLTEYHTRDGKTVSTQEMALLEGGSFLMGSNEVPEERPEFEIHVDPFYMDKFPVTIGEYTVFLEDTGHPPPKFWDVTDLSGPRQPVTGVTLDDAAAYASWAGKNLPTESQWEFAARGKANRKYPWGSLDPDTTRSNFGDYLGMPSIVTMHDSGATEDDIHDLAGNVYEWTLNPFVPYNLKAGGSVLVSKKEPRRVVRGGSWHSPEAELRTSARKGLFPQTQLTTVGFRCVLDAGKAHAQENG